MAFEPAGPSVLYINDVSNRFDFFEVKTISLLQIKLFHAKVSCCWVHLRGFVPKPGGAFTKNWGVDPDVHLRQFVGDLK